MSHPIAVKRQDDLGCAATTVGFDRDRVVTLSIPISPSATPFPSPLIGP